MGWLRFMVINIVLVLVYLIIATGVLQSPEPGFVYDFEQQLKFNDVVATSDDAVIVVGTVKGEDYEAGQDAFVAKINTAGEILWSQSFGEAGDDEFYNIKQTTTGFVLVGAKSENLDLSTNAYVVKINTAGEKQWSKTFKTPYNSRFNDLKINANGDLVLVGEIESATAENELNTNAYVVQTDKEGEEKWSKKIGGSNFTSAQDIADTKGEELYIAGHTNNEAGQQAWLLKMADEEKEWTKSYFSDGSSAFYSLEQLESGQLIAVGEANEESSCGYMAVLDQQGEQIGERLLGEEESSYSSFYTLTEVSPEELILGGVVSVPLGFGSVDSISYQNVAYTFKVNTHSQKMWSKKFAREKSGVLRGSAKINSEQVALVGNLSEYDVDSQGYLIFLKQ